MNPFTDTPARSVGALGEAGLIALIRDELRAVQPEPPFDIGDDCARLVPGERNLLTVDSVHYKYHFDDGVRPEDVAAKLLKRNLSDVAAMGGTPLEAVMAWHLPARTGMDWVRRFLRGLRDCAGEYATHIVGGDVAQTGDDLCISLTLTGRTASGVNRRGARVGDHLFVTGELGGSIRGGHYGFTPRLAEGRELAHEAGVNAMIDVSDGLARDLQHILPEGAVAALDVDALPASGDAVALAIETGRPAWEHALCDGEDYELLFALDGKADAGAFAERWNRGHGTPVTLVGEIRPRCPAHGDAVLFNMRSNSPLHLEGYAHWD